MVYVIEVPRMECTHDYTNECLFYDIIAAAAAIVQHAITVRIVEYGVRERERKEKKC